MDNTSRVFDGTYHREWRKTHPESFKASQEKYKNSVNGQLVRRKYTLKKKHGITIEQYDEMIMKQEHRCAICGIHQSELGKSFDVDHNHTTGKIRGILCNACNQAIGLLDDSVGLLSKAIDYLQKE